MMSLPEFTDVLLHALADTHTSLLSVHLYCNICRDLMVRSENSCSQKFFVYDYNGLHFYKQQLL
jgi:hypothetical protein